ncbi:hypothetical protein SRHO_G00209590 [Serrasalmus rhombeus]
MGTCLQSRAGNNPPPSACLALFFAVVFIRSGAVEMSSALYGHISVLSGSFRYFCVSAERLRSGCGWGGWLGLRWPGSGVSCGAGSLV